jgi:PST family polysaccharide transporter
MATQLVGLISRNLNTVLIGNRFGAELAGIYDRAFLLLMLPLNQINAPATTVALPVLSKLHDDPLRFERFILHGQTVLLHVLLAIFAFSAAAGEPLIVLVLGEQWSAAAPLFRILTIAGAFQTASYASYWAFLAKGLPHVVLRYSLVTRAGLVGLILLGLSWGMVGVTLAYSVGIACMWPLGLWWLGRNSDAPVRAMASNGVRALSAYLACTGVTFAAVHAARAAAPALQLVAAALAMLASVGFLYCTWPQYRRDLQAIANTRKLLGSGAGASQPDAPDAWGSA